MKDEFVSYPSAVVALCAETPEGPVGFVVTSFATGVSFDPPMVMFSAQRASRTWAELRVVPRIGVSVLGHEHQATCYQLASRSRDRFTGLDLVTTEGGAIFLQDAPLQMECEVAGEFPAGDHDVVTLRVHETVETPEVAPLIYRSREFHQLSAVF